jgi:deoxyribodipyrimidine photo-lyase
MAATALVWFRLDLRLADNPALHAASKRAGRVVPVFIWPPQEESPWSPGAASRWWLHQSLRELAGRLAAAGAPLVVRRGPAQQALERLVTETGASAAYWNRRYEPTVVARDTSIKHALTDRGVQVESFNSALLCEPWEIATKQGKPFQVFTPYWRAACGPDEPASPLPAPKHIPGGSPTTAPHSEPLDALQLEPTIDWAAGMREHWHPGEVGAIERLQQFVAQSVAP